MIKMNLIDVVNDLIKRSDEEEWFEFKVNWFEEEKTIIMLKDKTSIKPKSY